MTTPLLHIVGAFICLIFFERFSKRTTPPEKLFVLSLAAVLPDILDKTLTGTRYPFHSLVISGFILAILNLCVFYASSKDYSSFSRIQEYLVLASIAFLSHIFLDLEGLVPLFFPFDSRGYRIEFHLEIIQSFPPVFSDSVMRVIVESFDFSQSYDREGMLISSFDILLILAFLLIFILKGIEIFISRCFSTKIEGEVIDV